LSSATFLLSDLNLVLLPTIALSSGTCWMELMCEQVHYCDGHGCLFAPAELQYKVFPVSFSPLVIFLFSPKCEGLFLQIYI
jgi:hypothetical protein